MTASQCYADGYCTAFANEGDFFDFIKERGENAKWKRMKTNSVKVKAISEEQTDITIRPSVWEDTLRNTGLVLVTEEGETIDCMMGFPLEEVLEAFQEDIARVGDDYIEIVINL